MYAAGGRLAPGGAWKSGNSGMPTVPESAAHSQGWRLAGQSASAKKDLSESWVLGSRSQQFRGEGWGRCTAWAPPSQRRNWGTGAAAMPMQGSSLLSAPLQGPVSYGTSGKLNRNAL